ncbi:MAG: hypothetical protein HKN34_01540 [Gammaproteobacteria bacterium]|nr:hypothetical protein [Gammaproteobacteria bacterium]
MNDKESIEQRIKTVLDSQATSEDTRNALRRARAKALDAHETQPTVAWKPLAFASVFLVLGGLLVFSVNREADFPTAEIEDLAVINSEDELEFFEELEFYIWIDEEQKV